MRERMSIDFRLVEEFAPPARPVPKRAPNKHFLERLEIVEVDPAELVRPKKRARANTARGTAHGGFEFVNFDPSPSLPAIGAGSQQAPAGSAAPLPPAIAEPAQADRGYYTIDPSLVMKRPDSPLPMPTPLYRPFSPVYQPPSPSLGHYAPPPSPSSIEAVGFPSPSPFELDGGNALGLSRAYSPLSSGWSSQEGSSQGSEATIDDSLPLERGIVDYDFGLASATTSVQSILMELLQSRAAQYY